MARRRQLGEQEIRALAREAIDGVEGADDLQKAASEALRAAEEPRVRQAIVEGATSEAEEVTAAILRAALESGEERVARIAAELIPDLSESDAGVELLMECARDEDSDIRRRALEALESFSQPQLVPVLAEALLDDADIVRRSATGTLGIIIGTPSHALRERIREELGRPDSPLALAMVENEDIQVRRQMAQSLAFMDTDEVLPTLDRFCEDPDDEVRQEAVLSLAALGTEAALDVMAGRLDDDSYRVASSVLDMLAASLGSASSAFLEHIRRALKHPQAEVRRHAALMLSAYEPSEVLDVLREAAEDDDFEVSRRAGEMLRKTGEGRLDWLAGEMDRQTGGERARTVWEAGNIGQETRATIAGDGAAAASDVTAMLEKLLAEGSSSEKVHALNELSSLVDIGDSESMQRALDDPSSSVRSRAADTFAYTHDAGFLVEVMHNHRDPYVRRSAAETLIGNPGGPSRAGRVRQSLSFTSERTVGVTLYSHFLEALGDPDPVVQQHACEAIRECARRVSLLPVRRTLEELMRLIEDPGTSVLLQEDAEHAADMIEEAEDPLLIGDSAADLLEEWPELLQDASCLEWDSDAGAYRFAAAPDGETLMRWADRCDLSEEQTEGLRGAASGGEALDAEVASALIQMLAHDLGSTLDCFGYAARALAAVGQEGFEDELPRWASELASELSLPWEDDTPWRERLRRVRMRAWMEAEAAVAAFAEDTAVPSLAETVNDGDEWVQLTALAAAARLDRPEADSDRMAELCSRHAEEGEYCAPVGQAALELLKAGRAEGVTAVEGALESGSIAERGRLTRALMMAAHEERAMTLLRGRLRDGGATELAGLCLALAVRGAGGSLSDVEVAEADGFCEATCAALALRAMANETEAADKLKNLLREGDAEERYLSAGYLALARVWTAVLVYSSVRDQDVPYSVQLVCARAQVQQGHPGGISWFQKMSNSLSGRPLADLVTHMAQAVLDTIPLMLQCKTVNLGRFV